MARRRFTVLLAAALAASSARHTMAQLFVGDQGSTRSMSMVAPSLTVMDGAPGFIAATTQRPFVTSFVPIVAGYGGGFAPTYGPAALMPQYSPGISILPDRIARLKQSGYIPARAPSGGTRHADADDVSSERYIGDSLQSRLASVRQNVGSRSLESIAAIRDRQAKEQQAEEREIAALQRKRHEAQSAGKSQIARIYQQQIDRRSGKK